MNPPQRHIVFIPGKNPKPPADVHLGAIRRCISAGATASATPDMDAMLAGNFHLAAWNHLYYGRYADISVDLPWVERLLRDLPEDRCLPPPGSRWHSRWIRLLYTLGDLLPFLTRLVSDPEIRATMDETRCYFDNCNGVSARIREVVKDTMQPLLAAGNELLLIGHSLGSVIAFDTLWELSRREQRSWRVHLLTLGSPLGMFYVQHRLLGHRQRGALRYPDNILRWINIATAGDLTALDRHLRNDFHAMLRLGLVAEITDRTQGIHSHFRTAAGPNPHRCYGYFYNPVVAGLIADWLSGKPFRLDA